jgi:outer membrane murein-binding lipoprotein Lpp
MNNRVFNILAVAVIACVIAGCSKHKEEHSSDTKTWAEMDDFHMVMAETFHPYKDSADLAPVKFKVKELVESADKWTQAALPEKVDNEEMKTKLQQLKSETEALADVVQAKDDKAIGDQLVKVHDMFHQIQEMWYSGGEGHHDHH